MDIAVDELKRFCSSNFLLFFAVLGVGCLSGATARADVLTDAFRPPQGEVACSDVAFLEREKFVRCRQRFLQYDLPVYLEQVREARAKRLETERARIWAWLATPPNANCETVPEYELDKFDHECRAPDFQGDVLGGLQADLARLQAERDSLANQIAVIYERYERASKRQGEVERSGVSGNVEELADVLAILDETLAQMALIEQLGPVFQDVETMPPVKRMRLVQAPAGLELHARSDTAANPVERIRLPYETVVVIETEPDGTDQLPVIHPDFGLRYATSADLFAQ